ncbi:MAG: ypwA [Clostridiales bacterium]|jgi:carboxypeptidase Taq|nr:ypwA [Clostridiales bacterium]
MTVNETLERFKELSTKIASLSKGCTLFNWDNSTGAPVKAIEEKATYMGILATMAFEIGISPEMKESIYFLNDHIDELDEVYAKIIKDSVKEFEKMSKIPTKEYQEYSILTSQTETIWQEAKTNNDFTTFEPYLTKIVAFQRKMAEYFGYEKHPYDALLDAFEPGITVENLDKFFAKLRAEIVPLVKAIKESKKVIRRDILTMPYNIEKQKEFGNYILEKIGFDFTRGMAKESEHPFTTSIARDDVRITTHYYENLFSSAMYSTIHEGGHAIYEQNISENLKGTQLCDGCSMGIHESQSRFYENVIGRSLEFWKLFMPKAQELFPEQLGNVTVEEMFEASNIAEPSFIRTEADELTYALHVMVRYEIEKQLFTGDIEVKDLPRIWNEKMEEYLGIVPENDKIGVLQDVHWAAGLFGYFPSYALGNAYASQLVNTMKNSVDIEQAVENGEFNKIGDWLRENVHQYGKLLTPSEIIVKATGEELNADYFIDYLKTKYTAIYEL